MTFPKLRSILFLLISFFPASVWSNQDTLESLAKENVRYHEELLGLALDRAHVERTSQVNQRLLAFSQKLTAGASQSIQNFSQIQGENRVWMTNLLERLKQYKPAWQKVEDVDSYATELSQILAFESDYPSDEELAKREEDFISVVTKTIGIGKLIRRELAALVASPAANLIREQLQTDQITNQLRSKDEEIETLLLSLQRMAHLITLQRTKRKKTFEVIGATWRNILRAALSGENFLTAHELVLAAERAERGVYTSLLVAQLCSAGINKAHTLLRIYRVPLLTNRVVMAEIQKTREIQRNLPDYPIDQESKEAIQRTLDNTLPTLFSIRTAAYGASRYEMSKYVKTRLNFVRNILQQGNLKLTCQEIANSILEATDLVSQETMYIDFRTECFQG